MHEVKHLAGERKEEKERGREGGRKGRREGRGKEEQIKRKKKAPNLIPSLVSFGKDTTPSFKGSKSAPPYNWHLTSVRVSEHAAILAARKKTMCR